MASAKQRKCMAGAGAMALLCAASSNVMADTVTARYSAGPVMVTSVVSPEVTGDVNTRRMNWTRTDLPGPGVDSTAPGVFIAFGLETDQTSRADRDYTFEASTPELLGWSSQRIEAIQTLWAQRIGSVLSGGEQEVCAFQVAIWELTYDTDWNLDTGAFQLVNSPAIGSSKTLAQTWLNDIPTGSSWRPAVGVLIHEDIQDQIFAEIPTPGAAVGMAMGGLMLGRRRRR